MEDIRDALYNACRWSNKLVPYKRRGLQPSELHPILAELHRTLHVEFDPAHNMYHLPDAPPILFAYREFDLLYIKMILVKLQEDGVKCTIKEEHLLKTHGELLLTTMLDEAGYSVVSLLRKIRLRALLP